MTGSLSSSLNRNTQGKQPPAATTHPTSTVGYDDAYTLSGLGKSRRSPYHLGTYLVDRRTDGHIEPSRPSSVIVADIELAATTVVSAQVSAELASTLALVGRSVLIPVSRSVVVCVINR